jgi:hypothetical protein
MEINSDIYNIIPEVTPEPTPMTSLDWNAIMADTAELMVEAYPPLIMDILRNPLTIISLSFVAFMVFLSWFVKRRKKRR